MNQPVAAPSVQRLTWLDTMRGLSILWIAFFHFFITYDNGRFPWPVNLKTFPPFLSQCSATASGLSCTVDALMAGLFQRGPQAVGVFIILSGFGLTYSLTKTGFPQGGWIQWYGKRFMRLFPLYWLAHLIYLVSPFVYRHDSVDYRFLLSFLGDRFIPVDTMFYYLNPAWWYFGMILQLCLVYPLLFRMMQKTGVVWFLVIVGVMSLGSRYLLHFVLHAHWNYVQGGFFGSRVWEFGMGMALALVFRRQPQSVLRSLFSWPVLLAGIAIYSLGAFCYQPNVAFIFSDGLMGMGLFVMMAHVARGVSRVPYLNRGITLVGVYCYGVYLLHQPYVMYCGRLLVDWSMPLYVLAAAGILTGICWGAIGLERLTNRGVGFLEARYKLFSPSSPPTG